MSTFQAFTLDLWSILLLFGALQGLFFAVTLLLHQKGNKTSNRLLAFLLFIFSLHLAEYVMVASGLYQQAPHFIPAILCYVALLPFYAKPATAKIAFLAGIIKSGYVIFPLDQFILLALSTCQMLVYFYLTFTVLQNFEENSLAPRFYGGLRHSRAARFSVCFVCGLLCAFDGPDA